MRNLIAQKMPLGALGLQFACGTQMNGKTSGSCGFGENTGKEIDTLGRFGIIIVELHSKSIFGEPDKSAERGSQYDTQTREPDAGYTAVGKDASAGPFVALHPLDWQCDYFLVGGVF